MITSRGGKAESNDEDSVSLEEIEDHIARAFQATRWTRPSLMLWFTCSVLEYTVQAATLQ